MYHTPGIMKIVVNVRYRMFRGTAQLTVRATDPGGRTNARVDVSRLLTWAI